MFYKRVYNFQEVKEVYYRVNDEYKSDLVIQLEFDKKNRTLLKEANILEGTRVSNITAEGVLISSVEFEEALKKAINHFLRSVEFPNYLLVDKRNLHKKLSISDHEYDNSKIILK